MLWSGDAAWRLLQIQVADTNPGDSAGTNGSVDHSFNIKPPPEDSEGATTRRKHSWRIDGLVLLWATAATTARRKYGWIDSRVQLARANLNVHDKHHAKMKKLLHTLIMS